MERSYGHMVKRILVILLAMTMVFGITSCDKKDSGKTTSGSFKVSEGLNTNYSCTIDVVGVWGNFEALDKAAQDFRAYYPNIEVVYSPLSDASTDIKNRMASGKDIDIYLFNWLDTNDSTKSFAWENAVDLTTIGLDLDILDRNLLQTGYVDGQLKLMPMYRRMYGFMVNEDLLAEHNLSVPKTYKEFLACCETLKNAGVAPVLTEGTLNIVNTYNQHITARTISDKNTDSIIADALNGKDTYGIVGDNLKMIFDLTDKGYIHPDSNTLGGEYQEVILRFFEGDIPFVPYNTEHFSGTRKREAKSEKYTENPFKYSFIPFPGDSGYECVYEQLATVYLGIYDGIAEEKQPYVYEFFRYLLSDEGNYTMQHIKNMPSVNINTGLTDFPYFQGLGGKQVFAVGKDGFDLRFSELLHETYRGFEYGVSAEEYLGKSIEYINTKTK